MKKAFTLIEILVVLVIIAILSTIAYAAYGQTQVRARDSQRKSDIEAIASALKMYKAEHQKYPNTGFSASTCMQRQRSSSSNVYWDKLESALEPYMAEPIFKDPVNISYPASEDLSVSRPIWKDIASHNYTVTINNSGDAFIVASRLEAGKGNGIMVKRNSLYGCDTAAKSPAKERYPLGAGELGTYKADELYVVADNMITLP